MALNKDSVSAIKKEIKVIEQKKSEVQKQLNEVQENFNVIERRKNDLLFQISEYDKSIKAMEKDIAGNRDPISDIPAK